jgi:quercetin dioxygenase-like cupin family protein
MRQRIGLAVVALGVVALAVLIPAGGRPLVGAAAGEQDVTERVLLDNARVTVVEYVFPAGFRGEEHAAIADEFAYVLDGEFAVVTKGVGKRVVRRGEIEYASKGTIHYSLNEAKRPARVLVVLLKER